MIKSVDYLFEAIKVINPSDAFTKADDKLAWQNTLTAAESSMEILRHVIPFLTSCSQWTQILSQKEEVTVSLLRVACKSFEGGVAAIELAALDMSTPDPSRQVLAGVAEDLKRNFAKYFSEEYLESVLS